MINHPDRLTDQRQLVVCSLLLVAPLAEADWMQQFVFVMRRLIGLLQFVGPLSSSMRVTTHL